MLTFLWAAIIGGFVATLAQFFPRRTRKHLGSDVLLGIVGSLALTLLSRALGVFPAGWDLLIFPALGSAAVLFLTWLLFRRTSSLVLIQTGDSGNAGKAGGESENQTPSAKAAAAAQPAMLAQKPGEVFLSYASPDREFAKALALALHNEGWSVWWDRTILPGFKFDEVLEASLAAAKCVLVIWSKESITHDWVKNEARRRRILIPAVTADVTIPFEFRHIQAADLTGWPSPNHAGFQSLVASVSAIVGAPKPAAGASAG